MSRNAAENAKIAAEKREIYFVAFGMREPDG